MTQPRLEDDFDNHINFEWKKNNDIPAEYPRFTNFTHIDMQLERLKMEIAENPDNKFPLYLTTGRVVHHWHT